MNFLQLLGPALSLMIVTGGGIGLHYISYRRRRNRQRDRLHSQSYLKDEPALLERASWEPGLGKWDPEFRLDQEHRDFDAVSRAPAIPRVEQFEDVTRIHGREQ